MAILKNQISNRFQNHLQSEDERETGYLRVCVSGGPLNSRVGEKFRSDNSKGALSPTYLFFMGSEGHSATLPSSNFEGIGTGNLAPLGRQSSYPMPYGHKLNTIGIVGDTSSFQNWTLFINA
ncbi:hypothetical protein ACTXT7_012582 [Hymenolepis weldensis]